MTTRIELGNGQFADVREVDELRSGDRDAFNGAVKIAIDPDTSTALLPGNYRRLREKALAARVIEGWNLQHVIPSKRADSLDKLTFEQEDKLYAGLAEHIRAVAPDEDKDRPDPTESA